MAENLAKQKSAVDSILECPLCLHQLKLPHTLQQCLHSYCKTCLDKVPQNTQDGRQGWLCPMCDNFTKCDQVEHNTFIEELQKMQGEPKHFDEIKCEQCPEDCGLPTWKCADCKIGLCENAKITHLRIPMLKGHKVLQLDNEREKFIDNVLFCKMHENIPVQLNCRDCDQLICYTCNIADHEHHKAETVEQALERILPETEKSARQVVENINSREAQIEAVKKEIEQTKECYAYCRIQMDDHLEKVMCQMRAMKAQMEEDVNEQESIALALLKGIKQQLEKQLSQARIISNLTAVVTTETRHISQLQQLHNGLFENVKAIGETKIADIHFELPEAEFTEGHRIQEELENVFGGLRFDLNGTNISTSGKVWVNKDDNFLCHDFEAVADCILAKSLQIDIIGWCNRISLIDNKLWMPVGIDSFDYSIKLYNKYGKHEETIDTGGKKIHVVRKAYNGDLILGGNGLYITTKDFEEWTMLAEGKFSDVVVHQRSFFALEYDFEYIQQYSLEDGQWQCIHEHTLVEDEPTDLNLDSNSTLCFSGDNFLINSTRNKALYKFSDTRKYMQMFRKGNADLVFCQIDDKGKALIADFEGEHFYLLDTKQKGEIAIKETWQSISVEQVIDAVYDSGNNELWTLSGTKTIKLTKFIQNRIV